MLSRLLVSTCGSVVLIQARFQRELRNKDSLDGAVWTVGADGDGQQGAARSIPALKANPRHPKLWPDSELIFSKTSAVVSSQGNSLTASRPSYRRHWPRNIKLTADRMGGKV